MKAVNGGAGESAAGEAAEEQSDDIQSADEVTENTSESEKRSSTISSEDDGSFALLPGAYTYTASAEGYKSALDVPFTVAEDALTIDIALEAEAGDSDEENADEAGSEDAMEAEDAGNAEEYPPFDQSVTYNGVVVTVKADAGTFPAGAELSVSRVLLYEQRQADAAVDAVRDENTTVASSYTFDIKVLDDAGSELQPANGHAVSVAFSMDTVADENLTTTVYHIEEDGDGYTAASLETVEDGDTASAETDGFSLYTVEFVYESKQYILAGGESIALSTILSELGLVGEVATVSVSAPELFDAKRDENGEWTIVSHRAFSSQEWMKVEINGQDFMIDVTDDSEPVSYIDKNGGVQQISESYRYVQSGDTQWTGWHVLNANTTITDRITVSGVAHLILCDGWTLTAKEGITVSEGNTLNIYAGKNGTAGSASEIAGKGTLIAEVNNSLYYYAGIGGTFDTCGTVNIVGGTIEASGGGEAAGIGGGEYGAVGKITIENGEVTASGGARGGAGIGGGYGSTGGEVTISGGKVTAKGGKGSYGGGAGIGADMNSMKAAITLSYSATNGGVPDLPRILSSSYVGDVTMSGDFCEWLGTDAYGVVFDAANANVDLNKEAMAGLTIVPCPAGTHRIDVQLLPGYGSGAPRNRAFAAMKTKSGTEMPVVKAFAGSSLALRVEAAPGCEIEYRPSRLTGSDGQEIHPDRNDAFTMPDCDVSAYLTRWAWLQWAINRAANAEGSPSITLPADVRAEKWEKALAVPKGRPVTVDLAGYSIDRNLKKAGTNGGVIDVTGGLTVKDGSRSKTGKITGGYTVGNGGGVYVHGGGALAITGGAVTGSRAAQGGGVYAADGSFSVSGAPKITGNTCNGAANNVWLSRGAVIDVTGGLESGAAIGVTTASKPETDGTVTITRGLNGRGAPTAFASDEGYNVAWRKDGQEAVLALQETAQETVQETILPATLKASGKTALRLTWKAVDGAEGYDVFFTRCGSNTYKLAATVTNRLSYRFKKLRRHTSYKAYVRAWRTVNGVKTYTGVESLTLHAITGGYTRKITNPKRVTVKRKAVKLAPGGTVKMGAKVTGVRRGKKVISHVNRLRYYTTDPTVATVDAMGRITAVGVGKCTVYAVANNGIRKGTRVTVSEKTGKK